MNSSPKKVDFANTLRGFAALSVIMGHYLGVFWLGRDVVATLINAPPLPVSHGTPFLAKCLHFFPQFSWGIYGVALFFLISGFVIPFSLQNGSRLGFCVSRGFRIIPVYIVGFSFTLLAIFLNTRYFHTSWPYTWKEIMIHYLPGIRDVMGSRNIDGIIWTLEIEMKFYLLCAMMMRGLRRYSHHVFFVPIFLFLLACYGMHILPSCGQINRSLCQLVLSYNLSSQYIIFMFIGVVFHYLFCQKIKLMKACLIIASLLTLFYAQGWMSPYSGNLYFVLNYGLALLTFMFAYSQPKYFRANRIFNLLADISYPLYVIHGLAGYVALRLLLDNGYKAWLALIIVCSGTALLSWVVHHLIEQPTQTLGKRMSAVLSRRGLLKSGAQRQPLSQPI